MMLPTRTVQRTSLLSMAAAIALLLVACGGGGAGEDTRVANTDTLQVPATPKESDLMNVGGKIFSIPSPVQTALLIKKLGLPYQKDVPLATDLAANLTSRSQRALAIGVYGADLAYVCIHKDGQRALKNLQVIEQLSGQLDLSNAFDKKLIDGFKKNLSNEDSLLRFTGVAFRAADEYLKVNQRNDLSAWVLAGGWIESLYLTIAGTTDKVDPAVATRVSEQRRSLENLISLLESSDTDHGNAPLVAALKDLLSAYSGVSSTYEFKQPTVDAKNRTTYINSVSSATITPAALKAISEKVKAIRSSITA